MHHHRRTILAWAVASSIAMPAFAAENQAATEEGWIPLFDGRSLEGWRANENHETFVAQDGVLAAEGPRSHLFYVGKVCDHDFQNFEFKAEVMAFPGANSGVFFHSHWQESGWLNRGYEVQISNTPAAEGDYREWNRTGSLYGIRNVFKSIVADREWFTLYSKVEGRRVEIRVNDVLLVDYLEPDDPVRRGRMQGRVLGRGTFALQGHDAKSRVLFRHIQVRPLPDAPRPPDSRSPEEIRLQERITGYQMAYLPLIDFHVHLKGGLGIEKSLDHARRHGIPQGIAVNCGLGFPVTNDLAARAFFKSLEGRPVFRAMQAEGREWISLFSPEVMAEFDYVFTDAMTFHDRQGRRTRLWMKEEVFVEDPQDFMEMYVGKIEEILSREPIDIYVNATFLPEVLQADYDRLWTQARMDRVIRALVANGVALEINDRYRIPSIPFLQRAKQAGVKFAFGTNNGGAADLGHLEYCLDAIDACGLAKDDLFMPQPGRPRPRRP